MNDYKKYKKGATGLSRREALHSDLGTHLRAPVAAMSAGAAAAKGQERLAILFWNFGVLNTAYHGVFNDLGRRMAEAVERGFNCIRTESGAGVTHDAEGRPRGPLEFYAALPGQDRFTRELQHMSGGRIDPLKRLIELCTVAKRYKVKLIRSSWYYLHTFWFTDKKRTAEFLELPFERRLMYFARGLDYILKELRQRGLADVIDTAEIFNEVNGMSLFNRRQPVETVRKFRRLHEEALAFLKMRHPDIRFSLNTSSPSIDREIVPCNAQVWTFHSYYLWSIYEVIEQGLVRGVDSDLNDPAVYAPIRRFLRRDLVPSQAILSSREGCPPILPIWYRRIWMYRNLDPNAMPELERMLQESPEKRIDEFQQRATSAVQAGVRLRDEILPGIPLTLGEGATYCADHRLRWEERSDAYWEVVEHAACTYRERGFWGAVPRTNVGPTDPVWQEYPERLHRVNAVFSGLMP